MLNVVCGLLHKREIVREKLKIIVKHEYNEMVKDGFCEFDIYFNNVFVVTIQHTDLMGGFDEITRKNSTTLRDLLLEISTLDDYAFCEFSTIEIDDKKHIFYMEEKVASLIGKKTKINNEDYLSTALLHMCSIELEDYKRKQIVDSVKKGKEPLAVNNLFEFVGDSSFSFEKYGFVKNSVYYGSEVYEFNLPAGHSCPHAKECVVKVDRKTGKFSDLSNAYKCYAAAAERFPGVRDHRWKNFDFTSKGNKPIVPHFAKHVRIHASGDFYSQEYFDMWLEICRENPDKEFWAYTKSVNYWIARLGNIPDNLELTASYGGKFDNLIEDYNLKRVKVVSRKDVETTSKENEVLHNGEIYKVDTKDDVARMKKIKMFLLLDNNEKDANTSRNKKIVVESNITKAQQSLFS